ncbi:hypothetical protein [Falsiroseomonas selenitidurans]|uniref:Uncharacterized protein n=1 Tax=Falsiroseomonas selenitidurans TaxID=2716335 RepID=A0ABX1EEI5_9PROT|nr:hypothetical protein [Falsiroseomonas selenitidurans]NKC34347.1 hypothetical protein [Falsiroseomonas selenitidurans]
MEQGTSLADIAAVAGVILALAALWQGASRGAFEERVRVLSDDPAELDAAVARLRTMDPLGRYRAWIGALLATADRHLGRGRLLLHWQGLGWSLMLAALYVSVFLLATVIASGSMPLFAVSPDLRAESLGGPWQRALLMASLLSWLGLIFAAGYFNSRVEGTLRPRLAAGLRRLLGREAPAWLMHLAEAAPAAALFALGSAAFSNAPLLATAAVCAGLLVVPSLGLSMLPFIVVLMTGYLMPHTAVMHPVFVIALTSGLGALGVSLAPPMVPRDVPVGGLALMAAAIIGLLLAPVFTRIGTMSYLFVALILLLPLANALLDWISTAISRLLAEHLMRQRRLSWPALALHLVADILAAILLLLLLALLLPLALHWHWGFEIFTEFRMLRGEPVVNAAKYACLAVQQPLGTGLWATMMLGSTLVPTMLHLTLAVASPLIHWLGPRGRLARLLASAPEGPLPAKLRAQGMLPLAVARYERREQPLALGLGVALAFLLVLGVSLGIFRGLDLLAAAALGWPEATAGQLALWFASGFDTAMVRACFDLAG